MIYLDHGATSYPKPQGVRRAMLRALEDCANPGRGGYPAAMAAAEQVYRCRETAGELFGCRPEQVVFTGNCTHGLNIAIRTLVHPGDRVAVSGFEHNAVMRPLYALGAKIQVAGRELFHWDEMLTQWEKVLKSGVKAGIFTHISNVFGYILPVEEMSEMCRSYGVPFVVDAAQSAGILPVSLGRWGADFIAMPGHKGLLGPQGTGLLLCGRTPEPLLFGGTGSSSMEHGMPQDVPERAEAGTANVPGIAGLDAGMQLILQEGTEAIFARERALTEACIRVLQQRGWRVFAGAHQASTVSFLPPGDCQEFAQALAREGVAVRAGLHCAPLAHESAGTLDTGTVRIAVGYQTSVHQIRTFAQRILRMS